jgi:hypothetical protein
MRFTLLLLSVFFLSACVSASAVQLDTIELNTPLNLLEDLGEAPELNNTVWLNTDEPLRLCCPARNVDLWLNKLQKSNSLVEGMAQDISGSGAGCYRQSLP